MFGSDLLIAPIVEEDITTVQIYLPKNEEWINVFSGIKYEGGTVYDIKVTLNDLPVFCKVGSNIEKNIDKIFN